MLFTHRDRIKPVARIDQASRRLDALNAYRRELVELRVAIALRIKGLLRDYYPQALPMLGAEVWDPPSLPSQVALLLAPVQGQGRDSQALPLRQRQPQRQGVLRAGEATRQARGSGQAIAGLQVDPHPLPMLARQGSLRPGDLREKPRKAWLADSGGDEGDGVYR